MRINFISLMQYSFASVMVVFDILAKIVLWSYWFAIQVGTKAHIQAFEPITSSSNKTRALKNDLSWITVI